MLMYIGTRGINEHPCPAGTYFDRAGNIRIQNCITCTPGHYCLAGSASPTPCRGGTYSDRPQGMVS